MDICHRDQLRYTYLQKEVLSNWRLTIRDVIFFFPRRSYNMLAIDLNILTVLQTQFLQVCLSRPCSLVLRIYSPEQRAELVNLKIALFKNNTYLVIRVSSHNVLYCHGFSRSFYLLNVVCCDILSIAHS